MSAYIIDAVPTPIGRHTGALSSIRADDLAALPIATLKSEFSVDTMPQTADNVAEAGVFADEIIPVSIPQHEGDPVIFGTDEYPRPGTTAKKLGRLRGVNGPDKTATAGNGDDHRTAMTIG